MIESEEPLGEITIEDMTKDNLIYQQEEEVLKLWTDPHQLKKIGDLWCL